MSSVTPPKSSLGIGVTTVYLLERWLTPFALFVGAEASLRYGVLAGFGFALIGFLVFMSFSVVLLGIQKRMPEVTSMSDWLGRKLTGSAQTYFQYILKLLYSLDIFIVGVGGGMLWYAGFQIPMVMGTGLSLLVLWLIYLIIGKKQWARKYRIYILGSFFALLVFALVYPFLVSPLQAIYDGMRLYHPYLFVIQERELLVYTTATFAILMGRIIISPSAWKLAESHSKMKVRSTFLLAGAVWATLPIAFSTLLYPVISQGIMGEVEEVFYRAFQSIPSPAVKYILLVLIGVILMRAGKQVIKSLKLQQSGTSSGERFIYGFVILIAFIGYSIFQPTLLELFFLVGIFYASLFMPVIIMMFTSVTVGWILPIIFFISSITGMVAYVAEGHFNAIGVSVSLSSLLFIIYWIYRTIYQHQSKI